MPLSLQGNALNFYEGKIKSTSCSQIHSTRKHSSRMRTDRAVTRSSNKPVSMRLIVDRQTTVKTLPSLALDNKSLFASNCAR